MNNYAALLRGINVGGNNKLAMAELRQALSDAGLADVQSYIQSGNVTFRAAQSEPELTARIQRVLAEQFSIDVPVMVCSQATLQEIADANPFAGRDNLEKALQLYFLGAAAVDAKLDKLQQLKGPTEEFALLDKCFYLYAPDGIGRSKLAAAAEKQLAVTTTTRNWRSVNKILEMLS